MRKFTVSLLFMILTVSSTQIAAQKGKKMPAAEPVTETKVDINKVFKNWKPRNVGPASMSGRVTTIDAEVAIQIIYGLAPLPVVFGKQIIVV